MTNIQAMLNGALGKQHVGMEAQALLLDGSRRHASVRATLRSPGDATPSMRSTSG